MVSQLAAGLLVNVHQYGVLDANVSNVEDIKAQNPDINDDEFVVQTTERNWQQAEGRGFIYGYNVSRRPRSRFHCSCKRHRLLRSGPNMKRQRTQE